jgi:propionyl-CoA synthetase
MQVWDFSQPGKYMVTVLPLNKNSLGSGGKAVPGYRLHVLDNDGKEVPPGTDGNLTIKVHICCNGNVTVTKLPLPPGTLTTLYKARDRYLDSYIVKFPGYFQTGDAGNIDKDGYV